MARRQFNDGMEIVFEDFNKVGATIEKEMYDRVIYELLQRAENSFFDDGFLVNYATPTSVSVNSGVGFQTDNSVSDPEPTKRLLYRPSAVTLNITPPDLVNNRIDLVCVKADRAAGSTESRKYKAPITGDVTNENLVVSNDWEAELILVDGTPAGVPVAPAVPAGYIKLAELLVSAVTGMSGSGAVTDTRVLMPIGGSSTINSLSFVRLTQSAGLTLQQALTEVDAFLRDGTLRQNIFEDRVTDPTAPPIAGDLKLYNKGGLLFVRDFSGTVTPVGSGAGGGGGGARWIGDALQDVEYDQEVKRFAQGDAQLETLFIKVPQGYLPGRQIKLFLGFYSPSSSDEWAFDVSTFLVRKGQDAVDDTTNGHSDGSGDIVNDTAKEFRELEFDLTTAIGQINGFAVSPGDMLRVQLERVAPAGTEDTEDIRMIPSTTEVKFG